MENFQLVLSVLGGIAIVAVLVHGYWSIRKQQPKPLRDGTSARAKQEAGASRDKEGFDADGIGQVRVVKVNDEPEEAEPAPAAARVEPQVKQEPVIAPTRQEPVIKPEAEAPVLGEQASLFAEDELTTQPEEKVKPEAVEPVIEETPVQDVEPELEQEDELPDPQDVLVLHVCAKEGEELAGAELLPCLLTLNFKFGDMNIFHRHEDNAGTGKVLFSLANMVKPGVFDPDNMEQFSTQGIALFMTLPCHGDALRNFSIMLNSACQLADDLGAEVLDDRRQLWHADTKQAYLERIRAVVQ
ncbi:cell division protein ZipA [Shewanella submarina]|uniref:Cell division protein ZipA n=1 Tax=Shewanella submarina TaxID=2016376 RepID=A0ABV7G962_9GAMM|nr:cell division protein ZipA [Shewanella submarina]MCL1036582.1 cell division protein ZipA [Shewanella submarina]